jgi:hypothetical protein
MLKGGSEVGLEEEVENLSALGLGVVNEQSGGRSGTESPNALESPALVGAVQIDRGFREAIGSGIGIGAR